MADDFPQVVKLIYARGHEIGCHSNTHTWLNKMTFEECMEDTRTAIDSLQQCIGEKVKSYRAPAFSIGKSNTWAFDILAECGIEYDSSVYPATRDFGGFSDFGANEPVKVKHGNTVIKEFPIAMTQIMGRKMAYSGGGYFRFFPLWYIQKKKKNAPYSISYFHIDDLLVEQNKPMSREEYEEYFKETGTVIARYKRYVKANLGKSNAWDKFDRLLCTEGFVNIVQANRSVNWNDISEIEL